MHYRQTIDSFESCCPTRFLRPQASVNQICARHSVDETLADYPYLEQEDIMQALRYGPWRAEEREVVFAPN
jgi:uncharacterized protein (DUF433 family)